MEICKISRSSILVFLIMVTTFFLFFYVDFGENFSGLEKKLGNKDLADFNWTYVRYAR